jgi:hypothetical protein
MARGKDEGPGKDEEEEKDIVYAERMPARRFAMIAGSVAGLLTLAGAGYAVMGAIGDASSFIAAAMFGVVGLGTGTLGLLHAVQRNYVTRDVLRVELGFGEVIIPLESIDDVRLEQDTSGLRKRIYAERAQKVALVSGKKPLVRIAWKHGDEARVFYAGSLFPEQLKAAILAAAQHKRRAPAAAAKVRVDVSAQEVVEVAAAPAQQRKQMKR